MSRAAEASAENEERRDCVNKLARYSREMKEREKEEEQRGENETRDEHLDEGARAQWKIGNRVCA